MRQIHKCYQVATLVQTSRLQVQSACSCRALGLCSCYTQDSQSTAMAIVICMQH
jgi:hypothetical protein